MSFSVSHASVRTSAWIGAFVIVAAFIVLAPSVVHAQRADQGWPYSKRYYSGSGALYTYYANNCSPSDFEAAVDDGAFAWTNTPTPLVFGKVQTNCQPGDTGVDAFTGYWNDASNPAQTWNYTWVCTSNAGVNVCGWADIDYYPYSTIGSSVIRMNVYQNSFEDLGWFGMRNAITHELGHTLGLAHVPCSEALSIMNTGGCNSGIDTPTQKDINDINSMY